MLTIVSHSLTLVVDWPYHSRKCRQLYFNDALSVTGRGSYELCCQSKFDSGCVMQLESNTHISPLLTIESPVAQWLEHPY